MDKTTGGPLEKPLHKGEFLEAFAKIANRKAAGPDGVVGELLKYAPEEVAQKVACIVNRAFEMAAPISEYLGRGTLIPLPKPGKPAGPAANLRPVMLLQVVRKCLSLVTLKRCKEALGSFVPMSQSGFQAGRSTADVVWAGKFLASRACHYGDVIHMLGTDLSRAFDTISRAKLVSILQPLVPSDCLRLVKLLLADTTAKVRVGKATSEAFSLDIGSPQGDGLSPFLFVVYLERCLKDVRSRLPPRPSVDAGLPGETQYADDCNWYSRSREWLESVLQVIDEVFTEYGFIVNVEKTEWVELRLLTAEEGNSWQGVKQLGSLLGDEQDIKRRMQLAAGAYQSLNRLWFRRNIVSPSRRVRLYKAFVLPVLLYNCGTWGATKGQMNKVDAFHRRQLRHLLGVRWPNKISNENLYKQTGSTALSGTIIDRRMRLLGHVLRHDRSAPGQKAMEAYFKPGKRPRGRPRTSLPTCIASDLALLGIRFKTERDLETLRALAADKGRWRKLVRQTTTLRDNQDTC